MAPHLVLFEHAAGYALFRVREFEEVAAFLPQVEEAVSDVSKFSSVVNLIGFFPFKTAGDALSNINSVSEGIVSDDLKLFLETNMPKGKAVLGVSDSKLSASINDACGIKCSHIGVVPEVIRGIRQHFAKLVKGFSSATSDKSQLGLSHSYSRAKVKFNVNKSDNMIIQSIALLDQLDKDINTFCMRIREWYSYHFPELIKIVPENALYAKVVKLVKNRKELTSEKLEALEAILMDSARAQAVIDASKPSMGMDISPVDLLNIDMFASRVIGITEYRKELSTYLRSKMSVVAPNLAVLIGDTVGAGLISHSSFIGRAGAKNKGRISRYLANKCSIASRIDAFSEDATTVFGSKLKEQVEERLKFYETGDLPRKNVDVMNEAVEEAADELKKKKKKEKKKRKAEEASGDTTMDTTAGADTTQESADGDEPPKKKKKKKNKENEPEAAPEPVETVIEVADESVSKKKKKKKNKEEEEHKADVSLEEVVPEVNGSEKKKKKKKNKAE